MINEELLQKVLALLDGSAPKEDGNSQKKDETIGNVDYKGMCTDGTRLDRTHDQTAYRAE